MRIDLNPGAQSIPESNRSSAQNTASGSGLLASRSSVEDQAELSGAHTQIQALAAQASQLPEVREERVQALRQAVQSGHYRADPEKVAGSVLAHMMAGPAA